VDLFYLAFSETQRSSDNSIQSMNALSHVAQSPW